jgi:hypothetical protein
MEDGVLQSILGRLPSLGPHARDEAEATNVPLIRGQLERFRVRLQLWEHRQAELAKHLS